MSGLTPGQQATVDGAREALTRSHDLPIGTATNRELCWNIGRLEVGLEQALRLIDELRQASS